MRAALEGDGPSREVDVEKVDCGIGDVEDRVRNVEIRVVKLEVHLKLILEKITEMKEDIKALRKIEWSARSGGEAGRG